MPETTAQRRYRQLMQRNSVDLIDAWKEKEIALGKRSMPIPLMGIHFRRKDIYDIPPDDGPEHPAIGRLKKRRPHLPPDPEDSPLSGDELEAVYGGTIDPDSSSSGYSRHLTVQSFNSRPAAVTDVAHRRKQRAAAQVERASVSGRSGPRSRQHQAKTPSRLATVEGTTQAQSRSKPPLTRPKSPKATSRLPLRRLPVNELLLAYSPQEHATHDEPPSNVLVEVIQDPINAGGGSGPPKKRRASPIEDFGMNINESSLHTLASEQVPAENAPLTQIRKQFKKPRFTHQSVVALRSKQQNRTCRPHEGKPRLGDGFEGDELKIERRLPAEAQRKAAKPFLLKFSALQLEAGPLPEVKFETSSKELELKPAHGLIEHSIPAHSVQGEECAPGAETALSQASASTTGRRVLFSGSAEDEAIKARLSSVTAPRRVAYDISSDDSNTSDDDSDGEIEEDEESELETNVEMEGDEEDESQQEPNQFFQMNDPRREREECALPESAQQPRPAEHTIHAGVTFDFRDRMPPCTNPRTPFGKRRLMEVNERIIDEPMLEQRPSVTCGKGTMYQQTSSYVHAAALPRRPTTRTTTINHQNPRSILRKETITKHNQPSDTRPEATVPNTHRNSTVHLEDNESKYFTTASQTLSLGDGSSGSSISQPPSLIKPRTSDCHRLSSTARVPDSDRDIVVPSETSQKQTPTPSYLDMLLGKRDYGATLARQRDQRVSRDLKSLTRMVSREHGTSSQSVRRKSSVLPFQSPTKLR